jgi:hypothetical protein
VEAELHSDSEACIDIKYLHNVLLKTKLTYLRNSASCPCRQTTGTARRSTQRAVLIASKTLSRKIVI